MAQQIPCDICGRTTADFLITALGTGDTQGVGIECLSDFAETLTAAYDRLRSEAPAHDHGSDGMPDTDSMTQHVTASDPPDDSQAAADLTDQEWEDSAGIEGQSGRVDSAAETAEGGPEVPQEASPADVDR